MRSYIHAKAMHDNKEKVQGMICLEMIGYFDDREHSQYYPVQNLELIYGNKGNFITVVEKYGIGLLPSKKSLTIPRVLSGFKSL